MLKKLGHILILVSLGLSLSLCDQNKKANKKGGCNSDASVSPTPSISVSPSPSIFPSVSPTPTGLLDDDSDASFDLVDVTFAQVTEVLKQYVASCKPQGTTPALYDCADYSVVSTNLEELITALGTSAPADKVALVTHWINNGKPDTPVVAPIPGVGSPLPTAAPIPGSGDANPCL